ncbi:PPE family protein [Mycobacterium camsae]|uniref:PPE family protein n=1 Tax=Mycobacterium gordonae TaxID=1778 RepID=UPI00197FE644|nr:PPE family protein [Mycobacterium gordonae]
MVTDFGLLPPEVNSARMYSGPGAESTLAAANAWDSLATVLNSAAVSYGTVIAGLAVESWMGPASASMAAAAAPYAAWLSAAAVRAERTAGQARAAAAAYEAAFAMTVPPALIAVNREQLMSLVETNVLGQNSPAIEALQAEYAEMWAQDAAAMFDYAASSEAASTLLPFTAPTQTADPAGPTAAAAAAASTAGIPAISAQTLQGLAALLSPASSAIPGSAASITLPTPIGDLDIAAAYIAVTATASLSLSAVNTARPWIFGVGTTSKPTPDDDAVEPTEGTVLGSHRDAPPGIGGAPSAGVGQAALVGALTVPHSWTVAAPEIRLAVESLPSASGGVEPVPANLSAGPAALLGGMALAGMAGRGGTGTGSPASNESATDEDGQPKRKPTVVVIQQPPAGPSPGNRTQ